MSPRPVSYAEFMLNSFPPLIAARAQLGDEAGVRDLHGLGQRRRTRPSTGRCAIRGEYVVSVT